MKILSFGEVLWDIYPDRKRLGGAPLNFSAHFAKHGGQAYVLSAVGNDELGSDTLRMIADWGVHTDYISVRKDYPTGRCLVTLDDQSVPTYDLLQDMAYDHISCDRLTDSFDLLYFGTLALRNPENMEAVKRLIKEYHFPQILADVNIRPPFSSKESVQFSVQNATVLKVSTEELPVIAEYLGAAHLTDYADFAKELAKQYQQLNCILITRGADGAYALDCKTGKEYSCPAVKSQVVSTVGAGDSFAASFVYWYLQNKDIADCLVSAAKVAGFVVSKYDAVPDYNIEYL